MTNISRETFKSFNDVARIQQMELWNAYDREKCGGHFQISHNTNDFFVKKFGSITKAIEYVSGDGASYAADDRFVVFDNLGKISSYNYVEAIILDNLSEEAIETFCEWLRTQRNFNEWLSEKETDD